MQWLEIPFCSMCQFAIKEETVIINVRHCRLDALHTDIVHISLPEKGEHGQAEEEGRGGKERRRGNDGGR